MAMICRHKLQTALMFSAKEEELTQNGVALVQLYYMRPRPHNSMNADLFSVRLSTYVLCTSTSMVCYRPILSTCIPSSHPYCKYTAHRPSSKSPIQQVAHPASLPSSKSPIQQVAHPASRPSSKSPIQQVSYMYIIHKFLPRNKLNVSGDWL